MKTDKETKANAEQPDAPVTMAQVRELLDLQRAEHERHVGVLLERLATVPGVSQETITALNEKMLQGVNPFAYQTAQNEKHLDWLQGHQQRSVIDPWKALLTGQYGFLLVLETDPRESQDGRARADSFSSRVVFADGLSVEMAAHAAYGKFWQNIGCSRPHGFYQQIALAPDEAEKIRGELLALMESGANDDALRRRCIKHIAAKREAALAREATAKESASLDDVGSLPDRFQNVREAMMPGINSPFPTLSLDNDPGVVGIEHADAMGDASYLSPRI